MRVQVEVLVQEKLGYISFQRPGSRVDATQEAHLHRRR